MEDTPVAASADNNSIKAEQGDLKSEVIHGVTWATIASVMVRLLATISNLVLAKLLAPEVFGIIAAAYIVIAAMELFSDFGINKALIQYDGDIKLASNVALTLRLGQGIFLFILAAVFAKSFAYYYETPELRAIIIVLSLNFILSAMGTVPMTLLSRDLKFKQQLTPQVVPVTLQVVVSISMAAAGYGAWSIVAGLASMNIVRTWLFWRASPFKLRLQIDLKVTGALLKFGLPLFGNGLVLYFLYQIDKLVVGKTLGMEQLGYYAFAFIIINLPTTEVVYLLNRVMFPTYALIGRHKGELKNAYLKSLKYIMLIIVPLNFGIPVLGGDLFQALYGDKWVAAIAPLQAFGLFAFMRSMGATMSNIFLALGKTKFLFGIAAMCMVLVALFIYPAATIIGIAGVAWLFSAVWVIQTIIVVIYLQKFVNIGFTDILNQIKLPFIAALFAVLPVKYLVEHISGAHNLFVFTGLMILTAAIYTCAIVILDKVAGESIRQSWKKKRLVLI